MHPAQCRQLDGSPGRRPGRDAGLAPGQGPAGHRLDDPITILGHPPRTPADLLDHTQLGYTFDDDPLPGGTLVDLTVGAPARAAGIGARGEVDLYRFVAAAAGQYVVETSGQTDVVMTLLGPNDPATMITEDDDSGDDRNARIISMLSAGPLLRAGPTLQPGCGRQLRGRWRCGVNRGVPLKLLPHRRRVRASERSLVGLAGRCEVAQGSSTIASECVNAPVRPRASGSVVRVGLGRDR